MSLFEYGGHETPITLAFRRSGKQEEITFRGPVYELGKDQKQLTHIPREKLPKSDKLDLTGCPVVNIGGNL